MRRLFQLFNQPLRAWHGVLLAILAVTGYASAASQYVGSLILPTSATNISSSTGVKVQIVSHSGNSQNYNVSLSDPAGCGSQGILNLSTLGNFDCSGGYTTSAGTLSAAFFSSPAYSTSQSVLCSQNHIIGNCNVPPGVVTAVTASNPLISSGGTTPNISVSPSPAFTGTVSATGYIGSSLATASGPLELCGGNAGCANSLEIIGGGSAVADGNITADLALAAGTATPGPTGSISGSSDIVAGTSILAGTTITAGTQLFAGQNVTFGDTAASNQSTLGSGQNGSGCGIGTVNGFTFHSITGSSLIMVGDQSGNVGACGKFFANGGNAVPNAYASNIVLTSGTCTAGSFCSFTTTPACNGSGQVCYFAIHIVGASSGSVIPGTGTDGSGNNQLEGMLNETGGTIGAGTQVGYTRYDT